MSIVTGEKARRLVGQLRTIGLYESTFWASWITAFAPLVLASALFAPAVGVATGVVLFTRVDYGVHVAGFLTAGLAVLSNAMCCAACTRQQRWVNLAAFLNFGVYVTIATLFAILQFYFIIYAPVVPVALQAFVALFPAFHYGRLVNTILLHILGQGSTSGGGADSAAPPAPALPSQSSANLKLAVAPDSIAPPRYVPRFFLVFSWRKSLPRTCTSTALALAP
jgi:general stress protein CsbA